VLAHLPLVTIRPPQAAALSVKIGNKAGGTEGREPSLHVDTKCLLTAPFPPTAPSSGAYPLTPDCPPCGAVAPRTNRGIMCHGLGGQGARQPSLRSGRLRRPARAEWDNSRRRTPCPHCLVLHSGAYGSLLVVSALSHPWRRPFALVDTYQRPRRRRTPPHPHKSPCVAEKEGAADSPAPFMRRSGRQSPALTGAQVFALFPRGLEPSSLQHLVTPPDRPPPVQSVTGNACPLLLVDSCAVHVSTDTGGIINLEAQNDYNSGYPLLKRGVYYCSRLISCQYGTVFVKSGCHEIRFRGRLTCQKLASFFVC